MRERERERERETDGERETVSCENFVYVRDGKKDCESD